MKILGLDLGIGSIGWALIEIDENGTPMHILGLGSRIVNLTKEDADSFSGKGPTACANRTQNRTMRKMLDRYQARRKELTALLASLGMIDPRNRLLDLSPVEIWKLRADAATPGCRLTLAELGRVLLHLNQRRGYRHAKEDSGDSKQTEYVKKVNERSTTLIERGETPGQFFYNALKDSEHRGKNNTRSYNYRIKEKVLPRKAYEEELYTIMRVQSEYYPEVLTPEVIDSIRGIIFFQRPLKSCKHLVSFCEFESRTGITPEGKKFTYGPKVAPKSSPLAQVTRIWEAINNLRLVNINNKPGKRKRSNTPSITDLFNDVETMPRDARLLQYEYKLTKKERQALFDYLNTHERISEAQLRKILNLKEADGFKPDSAFKKGIQGNTTYTQLEKALEGVPNKEELLRFDLLFRKETSVNKSTGEIYEFDAVATDTKGCDHSDSGKPLEDTPLYRLWHTIYAISNREELAGVLARNFGITDEETVNRLFAIDFRKSGFSNRSTKFMRKLLPSLIDGLCYSEAAEKVGINHSGSLTTEENLQRALLPKLEQLPKGSLRQPVVEKVLNQMINVVNGIIARFGSIDEIRVELARELRQNKEKRIETEVRINKQEKENRKFAELISEQGLPPTRRNIQKYRMLHETGMRCIYCGKEMATVAGFLSGHGWEIEHIIPRSLLFDDSMSNKACSCRECNQEKGQRTAYDYMSGKPDPLFQQYMARVQDLFKNGKISRTKYNRLLTSGADIPVDFLERDLRLSQYIARESVGILRGICHNVFASSGSVTAFLRHMWGYDDVLHNLNYPRFAKADLVEDVTFTHNGQTHTESRIPGWSKRNDHRHHAVDALVIALTRQGYIQRLNNLSQERENIFNDLHLDEASNRVSFHLLEKWAQTRPHFSVSVVTDAVAGVAVSFKPLGKLVTRGKRYKYAGGRRQLMQDSDGTKNVPGGITIPRGALHEGTVYGVIKVLEKNVPLKNCFGSIDLLVDKKLEEIMSKRLADNGMDQKKAAKSLSKSPIIIDGKIVETADCYRKEVVARYTLGSVQYKNIDKIVDPVARELVRARYDECGQNQKKFEASLEERPLWLNKEAGLEIKRVTMFTGLKPESIVALRKDAEGNGFSFVKTGNNHHVAFYKSESGKIESFCVSFWTCVRRYLAGLPAVIDDPVLAWDHVANMPDQVLAEEVAQTLPPVNCQFLMSFVKNDMFILGLTDEEIRDAVTGQDNKVITSHLYRVKRISEGDYYFELNTNAEPIPVDSEKIKFFRESERYLRLSDKGLRGLNPLKVRVNSIGDVIFEPSYLSQNGLETEQI